VTGAPDGCVTPLRDNFNVTNDDDEDDYHHHGPLLLLLLLVVVNAGS